MPCSLALSAFRPPIGTHRERPRQGGKRAAQRMLAGVPAGICAGGERAGRRLWRLQNLCAVLGRAALLNCFLFTLGRNFCSPGAQISRPSAPVRALPPPPRDERDTPESDGPALLGQMEPHNFGPMREPGRRRRRLHHEGASRTRRHSCVAQPPPPVSRPSVCVSVSKMCTLCKAQLEAQLERLEWAGRTVQAGLCRPASDNAKSHMNQKKRDCPMGLA